MGQSLGIQNLRRNPVVARKNLHEITAKMMGQKNVTKSVEKHLKEAGVYYGGKKISKGRFERDLRKVSQHLQEKGVKETRFAKEIRGSLRKTKGLVRGGEAEKSFKGGVEQQMSAGQKTGGFRDLDKMTRHSLLHRYMSKGKLSGEDRAKLSDEGFEELKTVVQRFKSMNIYRRQTEREEDSGQPDENRIQPEKAQSSATSYEKDGNQSDQESATPSASKDQSAVPLQGGIGTQARPEENLERFSANIGTGLPADEKPSTEETSEISSEKKKPSSSKDEDTELPDMEIG